MKYAATFLVLLSSCHAGKKPDAAISDIQVVAETVDFAGVFYDTTCTFAPFSKFYLEIDTDSPDRVGIWVGWRIMQAYRDENPQCTLPALITENDPMRILKASQYKPKP